MDSRKLGLGDAMLLVGAVGIGLRANRMEWLEIAAYRQQMGYAGVQSALRAILPHAACITVALLGIRLRRPRPRWRRLARQPGAVACLAASALLLVIAVWVATTVAAGRIVVFDVSMMTGPFRGVPGNYLVLNYHWGAALVAYGDRVGFAVAGAWLSLLLSGRWRSEPTWLDRIGRALGWFWIGLPVVLWGSSFLL